MATLLQGGNQAPPHFLLVGGGWEEGDHWKWREREGERRERDGERQLAEQEVKKGCGSAEQEFKEDNDDRDRCVGVVRDS